MAYGQIQTFVWNPPPGWTGQPFPETFTVTTDIAAQIAKASTAIVGQINANTLLICGGPGKPNSLWAINNTIANCTDFTAGITVRAKMLTKACQDLQVAVIAYTSAIQYTNQLLAMKTATTVKTNEFTLALSDEKPTVPSTFIQQRNAISEGTLHSGIAKVEGAITGSINSVITGAGSAIADTSIYKTIASWFSNAVDVIEKAILPSSVYTALKKTSSQTATPEK